MVSYDDFKECMRQRAEEDTGGRAVVKSVRKINGVILDGLSIMTSDSNISPTIYLNSYFDDFKNLQESDDDALAEEPSCDGSFPLQAARISMEAAAASKSVNLTFFIILPP